MCARAYIAMFIQKMKMFMNLELFSSTRSDGILDGISTKCNGFENSVRKREVPQYSDRINPQLPNVLQ